MPTPALASDPALSRHPLRLTHPRAILLLTLATVALLIVFLGTGDPVDMMELFNLVPVREAFRNHHWLMPTLNGVPRLEKPPLPVWIPAAVASLFHNESLWLLRAPSLLMAWCAALAVYLLGCRFFQNPDDPLDEKGRPYALLAALLLPTLLVFNREARLATYDIYVTGFLTLGAMALARLAETQAALPPGRTRFARCAGWTLLAGIATGLSVMSKGPVPAATVMLPLGLWLLLFHRRWPVWLGVAVAALLSVAVFLPWLYVIGQRYPDAWHRWYTEFVQFGTGNAENPAAAGTYEQLHNNYFYYAAFLAWAAPLTPTLIGGLLLPFLPAQSQPRPAAVERRGRWLFWLALVGGLLILSIPAEKKPRYALQLFPFAALLCAAVWQEFLRLPSDKKIEPAAAIMLAAQALCFILPGLAGVLAVLWIKAGWPLPHFLAPASAPLHAMATLWIAALFAAVAAAGVYLWHLSFRRRFARALLWLALCSLSLGFVAQTAYRMDPTTHTNRVRQPLADAFALAQGNPVYTFPSGDARPWLSSLYFANQILPEETPQQLAAIADAHPDQPLYLAVVTDAGTPRGAQAQQLLADLERLSHRHPETLLTWTDESRTTRLLRFAPATER